MSAYTPAINLPYPITTYNTTNCTYPYVVTGSPYNTTNLDPAPTTTTATTVTSPCHYWTTSTNTTWIIGNATWNVNWWGEDPNHELTIWEFDEEYND